MFQVAGADDVIVPEPALPGRGDDLWQATCFELFLKSTGERAYYEFNFSPSTRWAAYRFESYRTGRTEHSQPVPPFIEVTGDSAGLALGAQLDLSGLPSETMRIGISAILEERGGHKSYWALAHPPGEPDFHDEACFALELAAARPA